MSSSARRAAFGRCLTGAAFVSLCACSALRQFDLVDLKMSCDEANRHAYRTLELMHFTVTAVDPALPGRPGTMRAFRDDGAERRSVTVTVTCDDHTARVDADENSRWIGKLEFKRGFYMSFRSLPRAPAIAGHEPTRTQGLQILMHPVRGPAAKLELGLDLAAAGVLPVRFTIDNGGDRRYGMDIGDAVLVRADGTRVAALALDEAVRRVVVHSPTEPEKPGLPPAEIRRRLAAQHLPPGTLDAREVRTGFLYYPLGDYHRGRLVVEDLESGDTEGVTVEF